MFYRLTITIDTILESQLCCLITDEAEILTLLYQMDKGGIEFLERNCLSETIRKFSFQFHKVMQSALKRKIEPGQKIVCIFLEDFPFLEDQDYKRYILMDRREANLIISLCDTGLKPVHKIFADGSFFDESGRASYGGFIENPMGERQNYSRSFSGGSSNLMELIGVAEGLERLKEIREIQINTDSRFVIRGLVQWVHFWRHNDWQTAYGQSVKYAEQWQRIDALCADKLIQFKWIKGHSGHEQQDFCHRLAQQSGQLIP